MIYKTFRTNTHTINLKLFVLIITVILCVESHSVNQADSLTIYLNSYDKLDSIQSSNKIINEYKYLEQVILKNGRAVKTDSLNIRDSLSSIIRNINFEISNYEKARALSCLLIESNKNDIDYKAFVSSVQVYGIGLIGLFDSYFALSSSIGLIENFNDKEYFKSMNEIRVKSSMNRLFGRTCSEISKAKRMFKHYAISNNQTKHIFDLEYEYKCN